MSTSLLYHTFAVRGYCYLKTEFAEGGVIFFVEAKPEKCRQQPGDFRSQRHRPAADGKPTAAWRIVSQSWHAEPRRTYTKSFERYVLELSQYMTIKGVAEHRGGRGVRSPADGLAPRAAEG